KSHEKKEAFPEDPSYFAKPMKSVEEMNFLELGREIVMRQSKGMPYGELEVERNVILANPLMCLLVVFIGAVIGAMTPKGGAIVSLTYTILFVLVYYVFFSVGKSLGENGGLHPVIAVWLTPSFFLSMCFYLYKKFNM
ncbi:MAG TPA: LptF/LptG family permease, partial [Leptospiraceae bacterium]|nr:LptF/LptG family permease [Leptospiraceae bacterium]